LEPEISHLDSSDQRTDFHRSNVRCSCFLAQASLFFLPPEWRSGLRHCIAVPLEILGSSPGSVAAGRARETHGAEHNWPSIVRVRGGFGQQRCPCIFVLGSFSSGFFAAKLTMKAWFTQSPLSSWCWDVSVTWTLFSSVLTYFQKGFLMIN
jgi:hypothetical protein